NKVVEMTKTVTPKIMTTITEAATNHSGACSGSMRVESGSSMHLRLGGAGRDSERPQRYAANNKQFRAIHMRVWLARIKTLLSPKSCGFFTHRTEENISEKPAARQFLSVSARLHLGHGVRCSGRAAQNECKSLMI